MTEREAIVAAASSLLRAAILLRDIVSAAPGSLLQGMPEDISMRLIATQYQDTFDRLPEDVKVEATELAMADPWLIEARRIDAEAQQENT